MFTSTLALGAGHEPTLLTDFAKGTGSWQRRVWPAGAPAQKFALQLAPADADGAPALALPVAFPERLEAVATYQANPAWATAGHMVWQFRVPADLPASAMLTIFSKDHDHLWRQVRQRLPEARDGQVTVAVPLRGQMAARTWECHGHRRPWHAMTATNLLEYGCILELDTGETTPWQGTVLLESVKLIPATPIPSLLPVQSFSYQPRRPAVGERLEFTIRLDAWPQAPFNPEHTSMKANITTPNGKVEQVNGFYFEDFLYNPEEWDKTKCLTPDGEPCFKIRYCPRQAGDHTANFQVQIDGKPYELPTTAFQVRDAEEDYYGFVYRDPDHDQFFAYENGQPFWGLGINVRSPFDNRYREVAPYSTWEDQGLAAYERLFRRYRDCGVNVVEVWMSSWWLALEWINDAPGFHGVGHYNQYRAWMLDHILRLAEENNIYLLLVINNHGKFGMTYDTEWSRNPYNKANGGFLEKCEDYFTDARARQATRDLLDYIVARWGASPNLLSWKLFTEVDLTGPSLEFYHDPSVAAWHREMGAYLKTIDIYQHPINTHWMLSYHRINDAIATLPELDFISTDAYYSLGSGTASLVKMLREGTVFAKERKKPMAITEFGGSSYADNMGNLMRQVPIGLWTGFFNEAGIIPMYWWFALVEEKNLYHHYEAIAKFGADEDRRGMATSNYVVAGTPLEMNLLTGKKRVLGWIFDQEYYYTDLENNEAKTVTATNVTVPAPEPGMYEIEFWNLEKGQVTDKQECAVNEQMKEIKLAIPNFTKNVAFKIVEKK